jgi:FixJ family two-component response regulator
MRRAAGAGPHVNEGAIAFAGDAATLGHRRAAVRVRQSRRATRTARSTVLVLLVDDEGSLRRALARTIRLAGYKVEAFASVAALVARGIPQDDACLVLDVDMRGTDGIHFKRALIESRCDLPTIFITAAESAVVAASAHALAPVAVLYKPFDKQDLLDALARTCR